MSIPQVSDKAEAGVRKGRGGGAHSGFCAICWDWIPIEDTGLIKGCEHAYCVNCILRWATYNETPSCPQCKYPFESLNVHRSLDGSIHDYMFEESVCLLLRAPWFVPVIVDDDKKDAPEDLDDYYRYEDDYEDEEADDLQDRFYMNSTRNIHIGNRRWGDNGYVRDGRKEARAVNAHNAGPSHDPKKNEATTTSGRRAKRALKRGAADTSAAAKDPQILQSSEHK